MKHDDDVSTLVMATSELLATWALRVVLTIVSGFFLWVGFQLLQPLVPEVSLRNACGMSIVLWIVGTEVRTRPRKQD